MYANQLKAKTTVGLNEKRVNIHKVKKKKKKNSLDKNAYQQKKKHLQTIEGSYNQSLTNIFKYHDQNWHQSNTSSISAQLNNIRW